MTTQRTKKQQDGFGKWYRTATSAERDLRVQAVEYEMRYFKDLTLEEKRIRKKLAYYQMETDGKWVDAESDLQLDLSISNRWLFHYRRLRKCDGYCNVKKRAITIKTGIVGEELKGILLHEMIHAYEGMLFPFYQEWLILDLYRRLGRRIGERKLHRFLDMSVSEFTMQVSHGILFLLKSLELDERLGWKRGTVFGYGREEILR